MRRAALIFTFVFFSIALTALFLPARIFEFQDGPEVVEQCENEPDKSKIYIYRSLTVAGYYLFGRAENTLPHEPNFGPCPYNEFKLKTYGGEFWLLGLLTGGTYLVKLRKRNG